MLLLLVRHALAADRDDMLYPDDSLRPLVARGRRIQMRMSRRLRRRGLVPAAILSSPWKRAWQTAGILGRETGLGKKARVACPALAADPVLEALAVAVGPRADDEIVALVGHEPWMGELASLLLTGSPTRLVVDFPKSGVLAIRTAAVAPAGGRLEFFAAPRGP
jgi:phosphohistidine phosphatase